METWIILLLLVVVIWVLFRPISKKELDRIKAQVLASEVYQRDSIDYQARVLGMIKTSIGDISLIDKYTSNNGYK